MRRAAEQRAHLLRGLAQVYNVYELFHTRYTLFKTVYTHKTTKAIEYMVTDALLEAGACAGWGCHRCAAALMCPCCSRRPRLGRRNLQVH